MVAGGGGPGADGFVGRYGSSTTPAWLLRAVGPGEDKIIASAPAPGGKLYAAGWFEQTTTIGTQSYPSNNNSRDLLLMRLNTFTGDPDFVRTFGGTGRDEISDAYGDGQ